MSKKITEETAIPRAPKKLPRPTAEQVGMPDQVDDSVKSPLGLYLKLNGVTLTSFVRAIATDYKTIQELANGTSEPTLWMAYEIERLTKGAVPMEAWLGMAKAKASLARLREKQDPEIQKFKSGTPAGGFSSPAEKGVKGGKVRARSGGGEGSEEVG